jgi:hypothetical protein
VRGIPFLGAGDGKGKYRIAVDISWTDLGNACLKLMDLSRLVQYPEPHLALDARSYM